MLDANGDILPDGGVANGNAGKMCIRDRIDIEDKECYNFFTKKS